MTDVEIRVRGAYERLSPTERLAADYFLEHVGSFYGTSIAQLSAESGVSQVSWVRFCKSIGFDGLKTMKRSLFDEMKDAAAENGLITEHGFTDIRDFTTLEQVVEGVRRSEVQAIEDTTRLLDINMLKGAVDALCTASCVHLFGLGASGQAASDLYSKLIRINKRVLFDRDFHVQLACAASLTRKDVAVLFSNSGLTKELLDVLKVVRRSGASRIAITRQGDNPLANGCSYVLCTSAPELDRRSGATSSRIAQLAIVDILFTAIANREYHKVESALENSYEVCREHRV
ncbi:MAG: MurR/RpiR family transcriptional regulator [Oscillospiraceae bacterium]|jgi:DNA-binding MurR/RpiR family transcriptional regulator|nr:MurR/RpiR family transcriptional regulator [Oscillospiraceae bacterium]